MTNPYESPKTRMVSKPSKLHRYLYAIAVTIVATIVVVGFLVGVTLLKGYLIELLHVDG